MIKELKGEWFKYDILLLFQEFAELQNVSPETNIYSTP